MDTEVKYLVFEGEGFPVEQSMLDNVPYEQRDLVRELMESGYYIDGLDIPRFLREDLTINLEKLELATTLAVIALEANSPVEDVTLKLRNLDDYFTTRGVNGIEFREREEKTFILGFVSSAAAEASTRDTLVVKFV